MADVDQEIESDDRSMYRLSDEERLAIRAGMDAARRGDFAIDDEIKALFRLHNRS
jgi:hypothetical protein